MRYGDRSDAELMASAQAGWSPAFAVLLHRHGPAVRSAVRHEPDPIAATRDVFLTALEELPRMDPEFPVREWLLDIAGTDRVPDPIIPLGEDERDAIWASLITAWPGLPRPPRAGLRRAALILGLVALAALVPILVFLAGEAPDPGAEELRAHPVAEEPTEGESTPTAEPLPTFSFPSVPEDQPRETPTPDPPPVTETPEPDGTTEPDPLPTESDEPDPDPTGDPEPDPEPTGDPSPDPEPTETEPSEPPIDPIPPIDPDPGEADGNATGTP
ncbi:MAG TPA: hypothetical protein VK906_10510 [Egicoccus sp.]|nr:hypothetical protein [Egicoccus sp.]HSK23600.1 hypothetical protein [Egicoccus sp.]